MGPQPPTQSASTTSVSPPWPSPSLPSPGSTSAAACPSTFPTSGRGVRGQRSPATPLRLALSRRRPLALQTARGHLKSAPGTLMLKGHLLPSISRITTSTRWLMEPTDCNPTYRLCSKLQQTGLQTNSSARHPWATATPVHSRQLTVLPTRGLGKKRIQSRKSHPGPALSPCGSQDSIPVARAASNKQEQQLFAHPLKTSRVSSIRQEL